MAGRGPVGTISALNGLSANGVWGRDDVAMRRTIAKMERECIGNNPCQHLRYNLQKMGTVLSGVKHIVASFFDSFFAGLTASPYLEDYYQRLCNGDRDLDNGILWESAEGAVTCGDVHRL